MSFDTFGDRLKEYEAVETGRRLEATMPVYARIDGRGFSKFTKGLARPYDGRMTKAMIETTKFLVGHTNAKLGYTQSDEISLVWWVSGENPLEQMFFDGKVQKLCSVLAGLTTAVFTREVLKSDEQFAAYANKLPHFDARVFNLPSLEEGANCFLWREQDARRNAISMTAHDLFSHKQLQGVNQNRMLQMIAEQGVDFEAYPAAFRRGTFIRRELVEHVYTEESRLAIPEAHRPAVGARVIRSELLELAMPPFSQVKNRVDVVFHGAEPDTSETDAGFIARIVGEASTIHPKG